MIFDDNLELQNDSALEQLDADAKIQTVNHIFMNFMEAGNLKHIAKVKYFEIHQETGELIRK